MADNQIDLQGLEKAIHPLPAHSIERGADYPKPHIEYGPAFEPDNAFEKAKYSAELERMKYAISLFESINGFVPGSLSVEDYYAARTLELFNSDTWIPLSYDCDETGSDESNSGDSNPVGTLPKRRWETMKVVGTKLSIKDTHAVNNETEHYANRTGAQHAAQRNAPTAPLSAANRAAPAVAGRTEADITPARANVRGPRGNAASGARNAPVGGRTPAVAGTAEADITPARANGRRPRGNTTSGARNAPVGGRAQSTAENKAQDLAAAEEAKKLARQNETPEQKKARLEAKREEDKQRALEASNATRGDYFRQTSKRVRPPPEIELKNGMPIGEAVPKELREHNPGPVKRQKKNSE